MATVLVTRPEKDADRTAERLRAEGHEAIVSPVLTVSAIDAPPPAGQIDAVIVASANVAAWMGRADIQEALAGRPVFAVGDHAADAIRAVGYGDVRSAAGASSDLANLAAHVVAPPARLLAPVGKVHGAGAFDLLRGRGFLVEPVVVYDAEPAEQLSAEAIAGLRYDVIDAVLHYSPRSARTFVELAQGAGGGDKLPRLKHVCLSREVADALPEQLRDSAFVADAPNEDALFAALSNALADGADSSSEDSSPQRARRAPRPRAPRVIEGEAARVVADAPSDQAAASQAQRIAASPRAADISAPIAPSGEASPRAEEIAEKAAASYEAAASPVAPTKDADTVRDESTRAAATRIPAAAPSSSAMSAVASSSSTTGAARPSASPKPAPDAPPSPRRAAIGGALVVGALAGAVAGLAAAFLPPLLSPPKPQAPPIDAATLDARVAPLASRNDVAGLQQKIDAAAGAMERDRAALRGDIDVLGKRIDGLAASLTALSAATAAANDPDLRKRIDDALQSLQGVGQRMQSIETKAQEIERAASARSAPAADAGAATRRHALANALMQALTRGAPYAAELDALRGLGAAPASVTALQPFAAGGAPPARALADEFKTLIPQILKQPAAQGSFVDRLAASARGLVRVRPLGEPSGDDPASLVARIEAALARNAFGDARAAFDRIPEAQRTAAAAWGQKLRQRAEAGAAAQTLLDDAARSLAAPPT